VRDGRSRSSKVIDFGTNRKRVCNFLLVINSNFGPILPRFKYIADFLLRGATPSVFHPNFGVFPLNYIADVVAPRCEDRKLIIRVINFELVNLYVHGTSTLQTNRQTDRQTDGRLTIAIPRFALRALRGKNRKRRTSCERHKSQLKLEIEHDLY